MNLEEIRDNFLLSMGCSIANNYKYIDDYGFDYRKGFEVK